MIYEKATELSDKLIKIRRDLHQIPEIDFDVENTVKYIEKTLDELEIEHYRPIDSGVVGLIRGVGNDKTLLIRADIDALPIEEKNNFDYKSKNIGKMHACGHDAHITCLLGACMILKDLSLKIKGNLKIVFQPAEETSGGAEPMINAGIMNNPDVTAAIALHVEPLEKVGKIQIRNGAIMACPDEFSIKIKGVGGHGATPEDCINPIVPAAKLISSLENIVKDNFNDPSECVVSVCSVNAGTSYNIIPAEISICGTARSLSHEVRNKIENKIEEYIKEACISYNCSYEYKYIRSYPPVINDKKMNEFVVNACKKINGFNEIITLEKSPMLGDDFAYFANIVPSSYFKLGVGNDVINKSLHSPDFNIDESSLALGASILAQIAVDYLERNE